MAETPVTTLGEGCNFYFRFNVSPLLASGVLEKGFTAYEYRVAKKIIGLFDYVEAKVENNRKYSLRVVMTDATKRPYCKSRFDIQMAGKVFPDRLFRPIVFYGSSCPLGWMLLPCLVFHPFGRIFEYVVVPLWPVARSA